MQPETAPSLTSSDSFLLRAQMSERRRTVLMAVTLAVMIALTVARRLTRGVVMLDNSVFVPYIIILLFGFGYQLIVLTVLRPYIREGRLVPKWRWIANAALDVAVPVGLLLVAALNSPRGPIAALSSPALLLMPIVILLSVLRLKPTFTLWTGLAAAAAHAGLAMRAMETTSAEPDQIPVLLSYSVLLALTGAAGALAAREVKRYVVEGAEDAAARERGQAVLERIERDLSVAREIQRGLLPTGKPDIAGFDIAGMNRPADQTGGDYYDWQKLTDGRLAVVMADVTGHGIGPALVMAVCRAYARASASIASNPAALMARLNELLHADLQGGRFITLAAAILDPSGRVDLVSAGHGPTLLYRAARGDVEMFGGDGLPLAVLPDENYGPSKEFTMQRGDVLVMLTDGYFECQNGGGQQYGTERLCEQLRITASGDADAIMHALDEAVLKFATGAPQNDDMTVVVAKRV